MLKVHEAPGARLAPETTRFAGLVLFGGGGLNKGVKTASDPVPQKPSAGTETAVDNIS